MENILTLTKEIISEMLLSLNYRIGNLNFKI